MGTTSSITMQSLGKIALRARIYVGKLLSCYSLELKQADSEIVLSLVSTQCRQNTKYLFLPVLCVCLSVRPSVRLSNTGTV